MADTISMNKLEYLAKMFSRAQNKIYENYVITSIYSKVAENVLFAVVAKTE